MRSTTSLLTSVAAGCLALALTGCGGSSSGSAAAGTGPSGVAAAESVAASAAADPDDGSAATGLFSDEEACDWLKKALPGVKAAKSGINAQLVLTAGLSGFFEMHGGLENANGYAFDDATSRSCKPEHDTAVKKAGIKSFGNL